MGSISRQPPVAPITIGYVISSLCPPSKSTQSAAIVFPHRCRPIKWQPLPNQARSAANRARTAVNPCYFSTHPFFQIMLQRLSMDSKKKSAAFGGKPRIFLFSMGKPFSNVRLFCCLAIILPCWRAMLAISLLVCFFANVVLFCYVRCWCLFLL